jgi:hypothetical protein
VAGGKGLRGFRIVQNRGGQVYTGYYTPPHPLYQMDQFLEFGLDEVSDNPITMWTPVLESLFIDI